MEEARSRYWRYCSTAQWEPNINICESPQVYHVSIELAGMRPEEIDVQVHHGRLTVQGQRTIPHPGGGDQMRMLHMEMDHGPFCREIELPGDVDADRIAARYKEGILWIELPKHRERTEP